MVGGEGSRRSSGEWAAGKVTSDFISGFSGSLCMHVFMTTDFWLVGLKASLHKRL